MAKPKPKPKPYVHSPGANKQAAAVYTAAAAKQFPVANPVYVPVTLPGEHGTSGGVDQKATDTYVLPEYPGEGGANYPPLDWRAYLTNWGFDDDIVNELDRIFRTYADPNQAGAAGLAYIRGTDWYKRTFPGIQEGLKLGVVSNEADYRAYTNQVNQLYQRYFGRNVTGAEVANTLGKGFSSTRVGQGLEGQAFIAANRGDFQYLAGAFDQGQLSEGELTAYGEEKAGLDSFLGQEVQRRLSQAQERFQGIFKGVLATPALSLTQFGRPYATSLSGGKSTTDVHA